MHRRSGPTPRGTERPQSEQASLFPFVCVTFVVGLLLSGVGAPCLTPQPALLAPRAYLRRARRSRWSDGARRRGVGSEAGGRGGRGGHGCDNDGVRARPRLAHLVRQLPLGRVVAHRAAVRLGHSWLRAARALSGGMAAEPLQPAILRTAATADAASAPPARAGWCGPLLSRPRVAGCGPLSTAKARQRFGQDGAAQASPLPEHASGRPKLPPAAAAPLLVLRRPVLRRGWRPGATYVRHRTVTTRLL